MGLTDWLYTNVFGGDDLATQGRSLDATLAAQNATDYGPGGKDYTPQNWATVLQHEATGNYDAQIAQDQQEESQQVGIGSLLIDILVLGAVGGAIWLFFKLNGVQLINRLQKNGKWYVVGIVGAILAGLLYWRLKKTASDANSTAQGLSQAIKTLNPLS